MIETLKDYLVSLGFSVDTSSLNAARSAMSAAENSVEQFSNSSVKSFALAGAGVIAFVAAANLSIAKFIGGLAQTSLENEIFARRMWMNTDAARAYTNSLDALGVSLQDLYLSPELMNKYLELNKLAKGMAVPDYNEQMRGVRDITFEFQKLKLEGTMALQWIGIYLTKYLARPMGGLKNGLSDINELIQKNLPKWADKVALVASWFVRMGLAAWKIRYALGAIMAAFAAFKLVGILSNPFGMMIIGLTALLLLIDDFSTYKDGGDSAFPKLWEWVDDLSKSMEDSGLSFKDFKKDLSDIVDSVSELGKTVADLTKQLGIDGGLAGAIKYGILSVLQILNDVLKGVNVGLKEFNDLITGKASIFDINELDKKYTGSEDEPMHPNDKAVFDFFRNIKDFFIKNSTGDSFSNAYGKSKGYMYNQSSFSGVTKITMSPVYHINGATNPQGVATQISRNNTALITRAVQGVIR